MLRILAVFVALLTGFGPAWAQIKIYGGDKLIEAIEYNDYHSTERYLLEGISPERVDSYGKTPLIVAALAGYEDLVELLIKHEARLDSKDKLGGAALSYAAKQGHVGVVEILLDAGVNIDAENRQGLTPLMLAAGEGRLEVVQLLLERNANAGRHDYTGRTALNWAERNGRQPVVRALHAAGVKE